MLLAITAAVADEAAAAGDALSTARGRGARETAVKGMR